MAQFVGTTSWKVVGSILHGAIGDSLWQSFRPGTDSSSNRNEYQEYLLWGKSGRHGGLTTSSPSFVDCLETWEPHPPVTHRACLDLLQGMLYLYIYLW
jgi:hypothetical protein